MVPIIAALDFSSASRYTAVYAADMAAAVPARLVLLHVNQMSEMALDSSKRGFQMDNAETRASVKLAELNRYFQLTDGNVIPVDKVVLHGVAENEIERFTSLQKALALVIGIPYSVKDSIQGNTCFEIAGSIVCPVILVPPGRLFGTASRVVIITDVAQADNDSFIAEVSEWLQIFASPLFELKIEVYAKQSIEYSMDKVLLNRRPDILVLACSQEGFAKHFFNLIERYQSVIEQLPVILSIIPGKTILKKPVENLRPGKKHNCAVCNGACRVKQGQVKIL